MPIEFRCPQCDKLLRVDSQAAGRQARCPACGAVSTVPPAEPEEPAGTPFRVPPPAGGEPSPFSPPPGPPAPPPGPPEPAAGPEEYALRDEPPGPFTYPPREHSEADDLASAFRPPSAGAWPTPPTPPAPAAPFGVRKGTLDFSDIFSRTWRIFEQNAGLCVGAGAILYGLFLAFTVLQYIPYIALMARAIDPPVFLLTYYGIVFAILPIQFWIGIGQSLFFLKVARGEKPSLGVLFSGFSRFWPILGGVLLFMLMMAVPYFVAVLVGGVGFGVAAAARSPELGILIIVIVALAFLLVVIPLWLTFSQFYFLILDRKAGVIESFGISRQVMQGNRLMLFLMMIVAIICVAFAYLLTCTVGLIAIFPLLTIFWAVVYLTVTGQPTGEMRPAYYPPTPMPPAGTPGL